MDQGPSTKMYPTPGAEADLPGPGVRLGDTAAHNATETPFGSVDWSTTVQSSTVWDLAVVPFLVAVSCVAPRTVHIAVWISATISLQPFGGVSLWGEAVVLMGALRAPGLTRHSCYSHRCGTSVCGSIPNLTVLLWRGLCDSRRSRRWFSGGCGGAFLQVAVLPSNTRVHGVAPGGAVAIWVPAQVPLQVCVGEGERCFLVTVWSLGAPGLTFLSADGFRGDAAVTCAISFITVVFFRRDHRLIWRSWGVVTAGYSAVLPASVGVSGVTPGLPLVVRVTTIVVVKAFAGVVVWGAVVFVWCLGRPSLAGFS